MIRKIIISSLILVFLITAWFITRLNALGVFDKTPAPYPELCYLLPDMPGPEDIEINFDTGIAYISSDDRRRHKTDPTEQGAIYRLDKNNDTTRMTGTEHHKDFHPHGISLFIENQIEYLFVISHRKPEQPIFGHDIYVFEISGNSLKETNHFTDDGFRSPNDLAATSKTSFYFTNDRKNLSGTAMLAEILLAQSGSNLSYFDGNKASVLIPELKFANGIRLSDDGNTLLVSESTGAQVRVYQRNSLDNSLREQAIIPLGNAPDNISVDNNGLFWVTDHVNTLANAAYGEDPEQKSPLRIFSLDPATKQAELRYEDDGSFFSSGSVAIPFNNQIILGSIFQPGVQLCQR